jgi:hypothetical protein
MIMASQLAELNKSNVLVVAADAAQKPSATSEVIMFLRMVVFGCCVDTRKKIQGIHHKSRQYKDLYGCYNKPRA